MSNENHERERIVIESSILAVTLLFIVAGVFKGFQETPMPLILGVVSL